MYPHRLVRRLLPVAAVFLFVLVIGWWFKSESISRSRSTGRAKNITGNAVADESNATAGKNQATAGNETPSVTSTAGSSPADPFTPAAQANVDSAQQPDASKPAFAPGLPPAAAGQPKPSTRALAAGGKSVASILQGADMSDPEINAHKVAELRLLDESQNNAVIAKANELGIPLRKDGPGHKVSILYDICGTVPLYRNTLNANAAISTGANLLVPAPYSLDGTGVRIGIWDGGSVRSTHQEFATSRVTKKNASAANDDHATHVAGTIGATGVQPAAKGMASKVNIDSYDWTSDYAEMTAAATTGPGDVTKLPLSNHSYGYTIGTTDTPTPTEYNPYLGTYETEAAAVDAIAASLPYYLPFWAAGNEQDLYTTFGGYESITFVGLAKNIMTIGAADDAVNGSGIRTPANAAIAYFSSLGPCDDGRIKPDVVANGINLYSSVATNNTAYDGTYSGTSMATPNAMGSTVLLEQLYAREFSGQRMRASMIKALLIHTADDRGNVGPDYKYGWGLMNVKAAADLILAHKASLAAPKLIEGTVTNAANVKTHTFTWDGVSPIRATLSWTDPAGTPQTTGANADPITDSRTPNLKHNLDAKITAPDGTTNYSPYVMPFVGTWTQASMAQNATTGKNNVDNVEQVYLAAPSQAGTYTVTVSVDGSLTTASQAYSLVITGGANVVSNPPPTVTLTSPADASSFLPDASVTVSATATDLTAGGATGTVTQVEFFAGSTSLGVDSSSPYSINWTPAASGTYVITAKATDSETATATSASSTINVLTGDGSPVVSSFTPSSGAGGSLVILSGSNFVGISSVKFNGTDATFTVDSAGQITATVPALATTGTITVTNSYGTGTSSTSFTVSQLPVLISQVYGGGGNSGATYKNDYIEIYNRSASPVSLSGWSVQYASTAGTTWAATPLSGILAAGKYYLVSLASGGAVGLNLPTPDATGTTNMSASNGKVALRNSTTAFTGSSPISATGLQDFVGYGTANAHEGAAAAPTHSNTTALFRAGGGATDTNENSADFSAAAPNPRNTSSGAPVTPVITSALTATGTAGSAFTYQITASNTPTAYDATGLPANLTINTTTGAITGIPAAAGSSSVTISATNAAGTGSATLALTINSTGGTPGLIAGWDFQTTTTGGTANAAAPSSPTTFNANFGAGTLYLNGTNGSSSWVTATSGNELTGFGGTALNAGSGFSTVTSGVASLAVVNTTANNKTMVFKFSMTGLKDLAVSYATQRSGTGFTSQKWEYSTDGASWTMAQTLPSLPAAYAVQTITTITGLDGAANAYLRLTVAGASSAAGNNRLDNIQLAATSNAITPVITPSGTLVAADTTYGSASPVPASFTVSGANMTAGILVSPPAGFEVSQTAGGTSGYAPTQTIGGTGTIASTTIYLRLTATTAVGFYSGNVACTSVGAAADVPTATSEVHLKSLTITADNQSKVFGSSLTLGAGQTAFTSSGLVGTESIGSVTLTASGGTATNDATGFYLLTPSAATGGTFNPGNYNINYVNGTLTVTAPSYSDWINGFQVGGETGVSDDHDKDGLPNAIENILGTAPDVPSAGLVAISKGANTLVFQHTRSNSIASDLTASYEWSDNLADWHASAASAGGVTVSIVPVVITDVSAPDNDLIEVTATITGSPATKIFVRLIAVK